MRPLPAVLIAVTAPLLLAGAALGAEDTSTYSRVSHGLAQRAYESGLRSFHLRKLPDAVRDFGEATRRDPACTIGWVDLSRALQRSDRQAEALAALQKAETAARDGDDREQRYVAAWA